MEGRKSPACRNNGLNRVTATELRGPGSYYFRDAGLTRFSVPLHLFPQYRAAPRRRRRVVLRPPGRINTFIDFDN